MTEDRSSLDGNGTPSPTGMIAGSHLGGDGSARGIARTGRSRRMRHSRRRRRRLARTNAFARHPLRSAAGALVLALIPLWISLGSALTNPSLGPTVAARFAEWTRDHGGSSLVNAIENYWYSHHPPPVGGRPAKGAIPAVVKTVVTLPPAPWYLPEPAPIPPIASPPLPGEGSWHPAGRLVDGIPAIYEAYLRPDAVHTSLVVGVAWMDTKLLSAQLYSGSYIPGGGPYLHSAPIDAGASANLDAAFNAGFRMNQAQGGYYTDGHVVVPLRSGAASFVVYHDGSVQIGSWGRDVTLNPDVASVRQNLKLLVDGGKAVAGIRDDDFSSWGFTVKNAIYVWRSAVGITANGALVYVGGPGLNISTLAEILVHAGAVRAMELDINTAWVNFTTFAPAPPGGPASPENGSDLLADMDSTPARYFAGDWQRDFFTMSITPGAGPNTSAVSPTTTSTARATG